MSRGRPTDYRPEFCELLVEKMKEGNSLASFAVDVGVSRDTCYDWMKAQPDFLYAYKRGQDCALEFWEKMLKRCAMGIPLKIDGVVYKNYNVTAMIFLMKARFTEYKDQLLLQTQEMDYNEPDGLKEPEPEEAAAS